MYKYKNTIIQLLNYSVTQLLSYSKGWRSQSNRLGDVFGKVGKQVGLSSEWQTGIIFYLR